MENKITQWSYSRYNVYKQCPLKAKLQFIDKLKEPQSPALKRGADIHSIAENYIVLPGRIAKVPEELTLHANLFRALRLQQKKKNSGMVVEEMWCFRKDWSVTKWNDWDNIWLRVKVDVAWHDGDKTLIVNDWKTGKFRSDSLDSYMEQMELYALGALLANEDIEEVKPRLTYLDTGDMFPVVPIIFDRKDIPKLKKDWVKKTKPMLNDTIFAPKANDYCKWCYFSKDKAGKCEY